MLPHYNCDPHYMNHHHGCHPEHAHFALCVPYDDTDVWAAIEDLQKLKDYIDNALDSILKKIYVPDSASGSYTAEGNAAGTINDDGTISWKTSTKIPTGDLNLWAGNDDPSDSDTANAIRSRNKSENDLKVV